MTRTTSPGAIIVGVDGGASKTDVVAVSVDGVVRARVRGPGSNHQLIGLTEAVSRIAGMVGELGLGRQPDITVLALAGADLPEEVTALDEACREEGLGRTIRVVNDVRAVLRAGTAATDAAAVLCGSGVNALAVRADGREAGFVALGGLTGDWGGGSDLGPATLAMAVRAEDGREPNSVLPRRVADAFGAGSATEVATEVHRGRRDRRDLRQLVPVLMRAARDGDGLARALVARQADELVCMLMAALHRIDLIDAELDIILAGGVLTHPGSVVLDLVLHRLAAVVSHSRTVILRERPVLGAVLLALDAVYDGRLPRGVERITRSDAAIWAN